MRHTGDLAFVARPTPMSLSPDTEALHLDARVQLALSQSDQQFQSADLAEAARQLNGLYTSNQLRLLDGAAGFCMQWRSAQVGQIGLASLSFGSQVQLDQQGDRPFVLVSTQLQGRARVQAQGLLAEGQRGFVVVDTPGQAVSKQFSADSQRCHVRVDLPTLQAKCQQLLQAPLPRPLQFEPFGSNQGVTQTRWFGLLHTLLSYAATPASPAHHLMLRALEEAVLLHLLLEHPHSCRAALLQPPPPLAPRHVRRAEDYLRAHLDQPLSLSDIAQAAGCSVRALNAGFRQFRQTTPMQQLKQLRLHAVRAELQQADAPQASISDIALRWGFAHLGRFASDYRQQFGERPSDTLRQR